MRGADIPIIKYDAFVEQFYYEAEAKGVLFSGMWELTYRCNLDCCYCYVPRDYLRGKSKEKEFTFEEICNIMDRLGEEGTLYLTFTGGEPLIRRDFLDIYALCQEERISNYTLY